MHLYNYSDINNFLNPGKKAFHLNNEWKEDLVTFNTQPEVNWESATKPFEGIPFNTWEAFNVSHIMRDIITGDSTNKGISVGTFAYSYGGCMYYSSEYEGQEFRPKLELLISDNLSPELELLTLNGEEDVEAGTEELVQWTVSDDESVASVVIHFNIDNEWILLDSITDGSTELMWTIPIYDYRKRCFFRLTAYDNTGKSSVDQSDEAFIIEKPTSIVATALTTKEQFHITKKGSQLSLRIDNALPAQVTYYDLRGQQLGAFSTNPSQSEYLLGQITGEKMLIFRIKDAKGLRSFTHIN